MKTLKTIAALGLLAASTATFANHGDPMEKMKMMDANGDGMVSKAEHDAFGTQHFDMMDTNKDGSLSAAEFKAGMEMKKDMKKDRMGK